MVNQFNEISYAKQMIESGFITNKRIYELDILAKYYFSLGLDRKQVEENILDFCYHYFEGFSEIRYFEKIESVLFHAQKTPIIEVGKIPVLKEDIEFINSLNQKYKFNETLFSLIVIKRLRTKLNHQPFLNYKYSKFYKMCGLKDTHELYEIIRTLIELNLVRLCRNGNIELIFELPNSDNVVCEISDLDSLYAYYRNIIGKGKYFECESCGKMIRKNNNKQKYCKECARKINILDTIARKSLK